MNRIALVCARPAPGRSRSVVIIHVIVVIMMVVVIMMIIDMMIVRMPIVVVAVMIGVTADAHNSDADQRCENESRQAAWGAGR